VNDHPRSAPAVERSAPAMVRPAAAADNDALLALVRRCPMKADISLIVERDPDFFALGRARGDAHTFVAEIDGALAGCLSIWRHGAWLGGSPAEICYVGDLRVAPEHRRRGIARQLATTLRDFQNMRPVVPYLLATGAGNSAVAPLAAAFGAVGPPIARFTSWQLLPVVPLKIAAHCDVGAAEPRDQAELAALFDDFYKSRDFSPVFSDGGLERLIRRSPGAQLSDYLVARLHGRMVAAIGVWDASSVRRTRVVGMPLWLRGLCAAGRGVSRIAPLPPFPQRDALLQFRYIRHAAFVRGGEPALKSLVRRAVNAARARGEHFVLYTCVDDDPLRCAIAGTPSLSFHYGITPFDFPPERPYFSGDSTPSAWCFDDAALA
jgi:GNAT superfamily N-acetyltransferase